MSITHTALDTPTESSMPVNSSSSPAEAAASTYIQEQSWEFAELSGAFRVQMGQAWLLQRDTTMAAAACVEQSLVDGCLLTDVAFLSPMARCAALVAAPLADINFSILGGEYAADQVSATGQEHAICMLLTSDFRSVGTGHKSTLSPDAHAMLACSRSVNLKNLLAGTNVVN